MRALLLLALFAAASSVGCKAKAKDEPSPSPAAAVVTSGGGPFICGEPWRADQQEAWRRGRSGALPKRASLPVSGLADGDLFDEVVARLQDKAVYRGIDSMTPAERTVHLVVVLDKEVYNGGFEQYLTNTSGSCAQRTLGAVRALGYAELETLYTRMLSKYPGGAPPEDGRARWNAVKGLPSDTWEADSRLFVTLDTATPLRRYIRAHLAELDLPPRR